MMSAEGAGMPETSGGLVKASIQVAREQWAWLRARADRKGRTSISAVIREMIDEARAAEREQATEGERVA
jgi:hypothetical protein